MEIWKDIKGYKGYYQVSSLGRVKSLSRYRPAYINNNNKILLKEKILKPTIYTNGYEYVSLSKNGERKNYMVHRLVAETFLDNPDNLSCVNHKDENKLNNQVNNLEWCSYKYNANYGTAIKRSAETRSKLLLEHNPRSRIVICVETGINYKSTREAGRQTGISCQNISKCCLGKRNTTGGYHWKYKEEQV